MNKKQAISMNKEQAIMEIEQQSKTGIKAFQVLPMMEWCVHFYLDEDRYLVKYMSSRDIGVEIGEAISSYMKDGDYLFHYQRLVNDVMNSFDVEWEIVPYRVLIIKTQPDIFSSGCYRYIQHLTVHFNQEYATMEQYAIFDFDEDRYLVKYKSSRDIGDEIEDAISSYMDSIDYLDYKQVVNDVMNSFDVEWEIVPCRRYLI